MTLLIGALTVGLILSLLALGVFITFRVFSFPDITVDGSFTLGACVAAVLVVKGCEPMLATAAGALAGMIAGATTGVLHTKFKINGLLAGILVMTALYTVNLRVMGKANQPLSDPDREVATLAVYAEKVGAFFSGGAATVNIGGWDVSVRDLALLLASLAAASAGAAVMFWFFRTELGTAMRATGDNPQMITAQGVSVGNMTIAGLALSNGLVGLAGAVLAQYQGFSDVQMGIGMVVWGLASVIMGEALVRVKSLGLLLVGTVMGSVLFRLLVATALRMGLDANDLKLITAVFVFAALVLPDLIGKMRRNTGAAAAGAADKKGAASNA